MAMESNTGFHLDETLGSVMNRHAISFRSGAINSTSEMIPMGSYFEMNTSSTGIVLQGNSNFVTTTSPGVVTTGNSSGSSLLLDSVPGLKHDAGLAVEWSVEEQYKLEQGHENFIVGSKYSTFDKFHAYRFKDEPSILRYIKIAATLRDKTVRDVALRCRWMTRKRRKEEHNAGKKVIHRKDKLLESSAKTNMASVLPQNTTAYPLIMQQVGQRELILSEDTTMQLLEQNARAFAQINDNLLTFKLQDNMDLLYQTRNNISSILNDMGHMPGIMSQMPPLNISINEDLANNYLPSMNQPIVFGSPNGIHMKQEPRC